MDENLAKYQSKYEECLRLIEEESMNETETEPRGPKNKTKAKLLTLKETLVKLLETNDNESEQHFLRFILAGILNRLGYMSEDTDEHEVEEIITEALKYVTDDLHPDFIMVAVDVRNKMGIFCSLRSKHEEAKNWLKESEKLYEEFKSRPNCTPRCFLHFLKEESTKCEKELETLHTNTKFYLSQVYKSLQELLNSAIYCHETLKRELLQEYDPVDWAVKSATLSEFFMDRFLFKQARQLLAAASCMLDSYEETLKGMEGSPEEIEAKRENWRHRSAHVSRYWACYGILLLQHSKDRLSSDASEESPEEKNEDLEKLRIDGLNVEPYENQISYSPVVAFEDAREVFLAAQRQLKKAKEYYTLEDRASDHVEIVQDHSRLLKHLSAFEADEERQFKMMKKRVEMVEPVLKELNPKIYVDVCRQLWFELGEIYHDMMQSKFHKLKELTEAPAPQLLKKINTLIESSQKNFNDFLDSLRDRKTKELPDPLPEELLTPAALAHFYLGRLYFKYITMDRLKQIENTNKAYDCFKYLVDSCEKYEKARNALAEELNMSREMMTMLKLKVMRL